MKKLLVTIDSLRDDHIKYMDNTKDYLKFEDKPVFATASATYSSFPSILNGEYTSENGVKKTVASEYDIPTIGISSNHLLTPRYGYDTGFDMFRSPSQNSGAAWKSTIGTLLNQGSKKHSIAVSMWSRLQYIRSKLGSEIGRDYIDSKEIIKDFNQKTKNKEEWFAWLHFMDPHHPYNSPESEYDRVKSKSISRKVISENGNKEEKNITKELYREEVEYLDNQLDKLWANLPEDTQIIFCSDHSEYLGEDDKWGHGLDLTPSLTKVPLAYKNIESKPEGEVVSLIDIPSILQGRNYNRGDLNRDVAYATADDMKAVYTIDGYKFNGQSFNYQDESIDNSTLDKYYEKFDSKSPSVISEGVKEDLESLGYI